MSKYSVRIDYLYAHDIKKIIEIVRGLPEWFTQGAVENVERDAGNMAGFVARINGIIRGLYCLMKENAVSI